MKSILWLRYRKKRNGILHLLAGALLLVAAAGVSQPASSTPQRRHVKPNRQETIDNVNPQDEETLALNVIRLVNTGALAYRDEYGRYPQWRELIKSPVFADLKQTFESVHLGKVELSPGSEIIPGYELRLFPSADGESYSLSLSEKTENCKASFFSDERGIIFQGKVVGCAE